MRKHEVKAIRLRSCDAHDLGAMHRLDTTCFEPPFRFSRFALREFAGAVNARSTVAEVSGVFAGFCILHLEEAQAGCVGYIVTLDVALEHRRAGVASALVQAMESQAVAEACAALTLHVHVDNVAAIEFYRRCGFAPSHTEPDFYGRGLDAQIWVKALHG